MAGEHHGENQFLAHEPIEVTLREFTFRLGVNPFAAKAFGYGRERGSEVLRVPAAGVPRIYVRPMRHLFVYARRGLITLQPLEFLPFRLTRHQ